MLRQWLARVVWSLLLPGLGAAPPAMVLEVEKGAVRGDAFDEPPPEGTVSCISCDPAVELPDAKISRMLTCVAYGAFHGVEYRHQPSGAEAVEGLIGLSAPADGQGAGGCAVHDHFNAANDIWVTPSVRNLLRSMYLKNDKAAYRPAGFTTGAVDVALHMPYGMKPELQPSEWVTILARVKNDLLSEAVFNASARVKAQASARRSIELAAKKFHDNAEKVSGNVTSGFLIEVKALKAELEAKNTELKAMDLGDSPTKVAAKITYLMLKDKLTTKMSDWKKEQEGIQHVAAQTESVLSTSQKQASDVKTAAPSEAEKSLCLFGSCVDGDLAVAPTSAAAAPASAVPSTKIRFHLYSEVAPVKIQPLIDWAAAQDPAEVELMVHPTEPLCSPADDATCDVRHAMHAMVVADAVVLGFGPRADVAVKFNTAMHQNYRVYYLPKDKCRSKSWISLGNFSFSRPEMESCPGEERWLPETR